MKKLISIIMGSKVSSEKILKNFEKKKFPEPKRLKEPFGSERKQT